MKNAVFWDMAPYRSCVNRCFEGNVPPKRRFTQDLHVATSQKTAFFLSVFCFTQKYKKSNVLRNIVLVCKKLAMLNNFRNQSVIINIKKVDCIYVI
jgi:hypothetical protein